MESASKDRLQTGGSGGSSFRQGTSTSKWSLAPIH